jgi:lysophospholipase L1-like esterase
LKRFLGNTSLVIGSLIVAVLAAEGLLRLTEQRYALSKVEFPDGYFTSDPVVGARQSFNRPRAEFYFPGPAFETFTNSLGCFDFEQTIAPGYVLVIGDSATWGYVPAEANWATRLGKLTGRQIVKCGVTGVGTRYETALLERLIERIGQTPAAVILLYTMNDLNDDYVYPSYRVVDGQRLDAFRSLDLATGSLDRYTDAELAAMYREVRPSMRQWLREHSLVAWIVYRGIFGRRQEPLPASMTARYEVELWELDDASRAWLREARESHIHRLLSLSERIHRMGAQFIVFDHDKGPHNSVLAARLPGHVDLYYQLNFSGAEEDFERYFHKFDGHWNVEGNRNAAQEMSDALRAAALLDPAAKPGN